MNHIEQWVDHLSVDQSKLGGLPICPFAKQSKYQIIETKDNYIKVPNEDFELLIFKLDKEISIDQLNELCNLLNKVISNLVFLPDHKDKKTNIQGIETSNGKYNLVLCQPKDKLLKARKQLNKTLYYSYWDQQYLKEILGSDYGNLD